MLANYLFCCSFFVAALAFYAKHFEGRSLFGCCSKQQTDIDNKKDDDAINERKSEAFDDNDIEMGKTVGGVSKSARKAKFGRDGTVSRKSAKQSEGTLARIRSAISTAESEEMLDVSKHRAIEQFFYLKFVPFEQRFRYAILGIFALISFLSITQVCLFLFFVCSFSIDFLQI